jgi:hypothetical protein
MKLERFNRKFNNKESYVKYFVIAGNENGKPISRGESATPLITSQKY